jgi:hypothetical protein
VGSLNLELLVGALLEFGITVFDGFPIYGDRAMDGSKLTTSQLDGCNGITSPTPEFPKVDGRTYDYDYRLTREYPYTLSCFSGKVLPETPQAIRTSMGAPRQRNCQWQTDSQSVIIQSGEVRVKAVGLSVPTQCLGDLSRSGGGCFGLLRHLDAIPHSEDLFVVARLECAVYFGQLGSGFPDARTNLFSAKRMGWHDCGHGAV